MSEDHNVPNVMGDLRRRAKRALWAAWISVVLVIMDIVVALIVASYQPAMPPLASIEPDHFAFPLGKVSEIDWERSMLQFAEKKKEKEATSMAEARKEEKSLQHKLERAELDVKKLEAENRQQELKLMFSTIPSTIARFSAVVLGLYLAQILVGISRFHFRLSHQLDISANTLALSGMDDMEKTRRLMTALSGSVEFGSPDRTPIDKLTGVLSGLVKKKPK